MMSHEHGKHMEHDISYQCFVGFMFYKLVNEISLKNYTVNPYAYKALKIGHL